MTFLIFGYSGQVATELRAQGPCIALGRDQVDLNDPAACVAAIEAHAPTAVINAAAYTAVDRAEAEEPLANRINAEAPAAMAQACAAHSIPFVHLSTDYVFDGTGTAAWKPSDPVAPQNAYGRSKLAGEDAVRAAGGIYAILRTSWVFSAHGANFVKTMLTLSQTRNALNVVADQIGGPTPADAIAAACRDVAQQLIDDPSKSGTYHFSGAPETSWDVFAREIFTRSGRTVAVTGIPTAAYPTPASRPANSRMDCTHLASTFGIAQPDWQAGLDRVLKQLDQVD
jgi:dTDP-4-dehydrorhamnose reductase